MNNFILNHLEILKNYNFKFPEIELRSLLNHTSKYNKEILFTNFNLNQINLDLFNSSFKRRLKNEPISKIFNKKEFWKYTFYVDNNVLDPRPETELIIETAEKYFQNKKAKLKILDIGTGSGCLAISLANEYCNSVVFGTDISKSAINIAKKNSKRINLFQNIKFVECDWFDDSQDFDLIVSNPPYLTNNELYKIALEMNDCEPKIALKGGEDGLDCYRKLSKKLIKIMNINSYCFLEIGYNQAIECIKIFEKCSIKCINIVRDYQNIERILVLKK